MPDPLFAITLELAVGSQTNVTSYCLRASWERKLADAFTALSPDQATFDFANDVGSFSPLKNLNIVPGRRIQVQATHSGSTYSLFSGKLLEAHVQPGPGLRSAVLAAVSDVDRLSRTVLTTSLYQNINAGSLFTNLMSLSAVASFAADVLTDKIPFAWYQDRPATNAIAELVQSGNYETYVDGAGTVRLKGRYWTLLGSSSAASSLDAWFGLTGRLDSADVINDAKINAQPRKLGTSQQTLSWIGAAIAIPGSGFVALTAAFADPLERSQPVPCASLTTPVANTDYAIFQNSEGTGTDYTATASVALTLYGATAVCTIFNGQGNPAFLTTFQLRGQVAERLAVFGISRSDSASINDYGRRGVEISNPLIQDFNYVTGYTSLIVGERKDPRPTISYTLVNDWPEQLGREVGDLVALNETATGVSSLWQVRSMQHEVALAAGVEHQTVYEVQRSTSRPWLVLDHAVFGKLDGTRQLGL